MSGESGIREAGLEKWQVNDKWNWGTIKIEDLSENTDKVVKPKRLCQTNVQNPCPLKNDYFQHI